MEGYAKYSPENSKWTKHTVAEHVAIGGNGPILVGTPAQVADGLETWIKEADVDGFNFVSSVLYIHIFLPLKSPTRARRSFANSNKAYALFPQSFKDIIDLLLPELKARGLFWDGYAVENGTYRENFYGVKGQKVPLDEHVASTYQWKAGVPAGEHKIPAEASQSS